MKKYIVIHPILAMAIILLTVACGQKETSTDEPQDSPDRSGVVFTPEQVRNAKMKFGGFVDAQLSHDVFAKGKLKLPNNNIAEVNTTIGGMVSDIFVHQGESVKKGQTLCRLVHPDIIRMQEDYLKAKYELSVAQQQYKRLKLLAGEDVASQKSFQLAEKEFLTSSIHFESLQMNARVAGFDMELLDQGKLKEYLDIRSPLPGKVSNIFIHIGEYIEPGMPMFHVVDKSELHAEIMVFERDIPYVKTGQRVELSLSNISEEVFEGKVYTISSIMEETARTIPVIVHFEQVPDNSYPGMFVAATIHTGENTYRALPEDAIVTEKDGENYIYYTLDDPEASPEISFDKVRVSPILIEDGYASMNLLDSLPTDARIVLDGGYYIRSMFIRSVE